MCEFNLNKNWTRRGFIKGSGLAAFSCSLGGIPSFLKQTTKMVQATGPFDRRKTLVCIFQRGAMDGIMAVQPIEDPNLNQLRPDLTYSAARAAGANQLLDLDGRFGLHPQLKALFPLFREKQLAIIHGVGSPLPNRSHFDAQDYMESGTPGDKGTTTGWLNRAIGLMGHEATPFRAVSITPSMPRAFYGKQATLAVEHLEDLFLQSANKNETLELFRALYESNSDTQLKMAGKTSLEAQRILESIELDEYLTLSIQILIWGTA